MNVKQRILELMKKREWSKYKLSKETGIYITTINDWFNEKQYTPSRDSIVSICEAMGITLAEFYGGIEEHDLSRETIKVAFIVRNCTRKSKEINFRVYGSTCKRVSKL